MTPAARLLSWGGLGSQRLRSLPSRLGNSPRLPAVELLVLVTSECVPFAQASSFRCPSLLFSGRLLGATVGHRVLGPGMTRFYPGHGAPGRTALASAAAEMG